MKRKAKSSAIRRAAADKGRPGAINPHYLCAEIPRRWRRCDRRQQGIRNARSSTTRSCAPAPALDRFRGRRLGSSSGTALGIKLARPDATVLQMVGDGRLLFRRRLPDNAQRRFLHRRPARVVEEHRENGSFVLLGDGRTRRTGCQIEAAVADHLQHGRVGRASLIPSAVPDAAKPRPRNRSRSRGGVRPPLIWLLTIEPLRMPSLTTDRIVADRLGNLGAKVSAGLIRAGLPLSAACHGEFARRSSAFALSSLPFLFAAASRNAGVGLLLSTLRSSCLRSGRCRPAHGRSRRSPRWGKILHHVHVECAPTGLRILFRGASGSTARRRRRAADVGLRDGGHDSGKSTAEAREMLR